jgi:hypothetical protein
MSPVDYIDLPTMSDICFGKHACEACQDYSYPNPCPCGETTADDDAGAER